MTATLRVPLPRAVVVSYLVLGSFPVPDTLPVPMAAGLRVVATAPNELPVPPAPLLSASGTSAAAAAVLAEATQAWALLLRCGPGRAFAADAWVRAAALEMASRAGGALVDTAVSRAYLPCDKGADAATTADLFVFDKDPQGETTRVTTRGLARFGLPELCAEGVPAAHAPAWDALLTAVAHIVVGCLRRPGEHQPWLELPLPLTVRLADIAAGYGEVLEGEQGPGSAELALHRRTSGAGDDLLVVGAGGEELARLFGQALPAR